MHRPYSFHHPRQRIQRYKLLPELTRPDSDPAALPAPFQDLQALDIPRSAQNFRRQRFDPTRVPKEAHDHRKHQEHSSYDENTCPFSFLIFQIVFLPTTIIYAKAMTAPTTAAAATPTPPVTITATAKEAYCFLIEHFEHTYFRNCK